MSHASNIRIPRSPLSSVHYRPRFSPLFVSGGHISVCQLVRQEGFEALLEVERTLKKQQNTQLNSNTP